MPLPYKPTFFKILKLLCLNILLYISFYQILSKLFKINIVFFIVLLYNTLSKHALRRANGRVLCDRVPWTMSGGEPSSIKRISLCAAVNSVVRTP